ncbi:MAG: GAP family protein [Candidatus Aquicultorales bacterium]
MEKTLLQVLPLAIAGTVSPTGLLFVMMILSGKDNPKKNALSFVIGSTIFLIVLALVVDFVYRSAVRASNHPSLLSAFIDLGLGVLILAIVARSVFTKKKKKPPSEHKRKIPYLFVGFAYMIINVSTLIPFIAANKIIADARLGLADDLALLAMLLAITMMMVAFPVIVTYTAPKSSERILGPVTAFMSKHGAQIANAYFALMAAYLIFKGLRAL